MNEQVLLDARPHGWVLARPVLALLGVCALGGGVAGSMHDPRARWLVLAAAVVVLVPLSLLPWLRWLRTSVVVTDRRLVLRWGLLRRYGRDVPLDRVAEVLTRQSVGQRLRRAGTLTVVPVEGSAVVLPELRDVERVRALLYGPRDG